MSLRRIWIGLFVLGALLGTAESAHAGNYIVYLHGRAMNGWPTAALLGATPAWSHVRMSYNGSASLGDNAVQGPINDTIATYCGGGNQCVVICYSAGCARMLLAYKQLKDQSRYPGGILWSEATASAAGGSEVAAVTTKWWAKLLAKIFGVEQTAPVDYDIQPNPMRSGAYAGIQNQATAPVYHLAGSADICQTFSILWMVRVKLCGNKQFPGGYGDGAVPVHSAAGYADTGAHASTQDGSAKYIFRAYEQTPLYPFDHRGAFGPLVSAASLRLGVGKIVACPNMPAVAATVPDASIIYDDGDGAFTNESSPLNMVVVCGENMWNGAPPLYASCKAANGCCTAFSTGDAGGCTCGETLCKQVQVARRSYYTGNDCTGTEYAEALSLTDYVSYNGLGMDGETTASVLVRSARSWPDGRCQALLRETCRGRAGYCCDTTRVGTTLAAMRRVYRPAGGPPPPAGTTTGVVVSTIIYPNGHCP